MMNTHKSPEDRIKELGLRLPAPPKPVATYLPAVRVGNLLFLSGHGPIEGGRPLVTGKVDRDVSEEEAYRVAADVALRCLSTIRSVTGSLDRVERIVRLVGYIASSDGFNKQSQVLNGASDLLVRVFGERGLHARSAVGVKELPLNIPVEIEMVVLLKG